MSEVERVVASFLLGPKGRVVLPASVRRTAGIEVGDMVIAVAHSDGRIVLETPRAIESRVWAHAPAEGGSDATEEIRQLRAEDNRVSDEADRRRSASREPADDADAIDEAGARLLAELGL